MYTSRWTAEIVRDAAPSYGGDDGTGGAYAGEEILRDLADARDAAGAERVLARFAAFRAWLLRLEGQSSELTEHARAAAAAHLDAAPDDWPEAALLRRLLAIPVGGEETAAVLAAAAMESARSGEPEGARALMLAARAAMLRGLDDPPPAN